MKKNKNYIELQMIIVLIGQMTNMIIAISLMHGVAGDLKMMLTFASDNFGKGVLLIAVLFSILSIAASIFLIPNIDRIKRLDQIESEMIEQKEKYRLATEAFKNLQKSEIIG